jgi:hypothetical protein
LVNFKIKKMAVNKVEIYVSQILEDLDNGLTWLKRDDVGYGSIQDKYNAKDQQIAMIRKHPKLKDAETNIIVFTVIDDTNGSEDRAVQPTTSRTLGSLSESGTELENLQTETIGQDTDVPVETEDLGRTPELADATDAFANL